MAILRDLDAATLEDVQSFFDTYYSPTQRSDLRLLAILKSKMPKNGFSSYFGEIPPAEIPEPAGHFRSARKLKKKGLRRKTNWRTNQPLH